MILNKKSKINVLYKTINLMNLIFLDNSQSRREPVCELGVKQ